MTVAYVCRVQNDVSRQMSVGFASCMREVDAFLAQTGNGSAIDTQLRAHLVRRLSRCCRRSLASSAAMFTGSGCRDDGQPSSSISISGSGLLPRKLCFDESRDQVRGAPLRDINDNTRHSQRTSGSHEAYKQRHLTSALVSSGSENVDLQCVSGHQQLNVANIGVQYISSTTSTSSQHQSRCEQQNEAPSHSLCSSSISSMDAAGFDFSIWNSNVKPEPLTPVWRPW